MGNTTEEKDLQKQTQKETTTSILTQNVKGSNLQDSAGFQKRFSKASWHIDPAVDYWFYLQKQRNTNQRAYEIQSTECFFYPPMRKNYRFPGNWLRPVLPLLKPCFFLHLHKHSGLTLYRWHVALTELSGKISLKPCAYCSLSVPTTETVELLWEF